MSDTKTKLKKLSDTKIKKMYKMHDKVIANITKTVSTLKELRKTIRQEYKDKTADIHPLFIDFITFFVF